MVQYLKKHASQRKSLNQQPPSPMGEYLPRSGVGRERDKPVLMLFSLFYRLLII
jgi:hypothetical protein